MEAVSLAILIGAGLLFVSIFTSLISSRIGAPLLLVFLLLGLLAGEDGLGLEFDDAGAAFFIGTVALALILFDSGFNTRLASYRAAAAPALLLATAGVILTAAIFAAVARLVLPLTWPEALLLGAIVSSTDAAAVFFLLRVGGIRLRERVRATLEIESGTNDPMAVFLTLSLAEIVVAGETSPSWALLGDFAVQIVGGAAFGYAGGRLLVLLIARVRLEPGLYAVLAVAAALLVLSATSLVGGSGFLAVYVAGLVLGNGGLPVTPTLRRFLDGLTWLAQIAMFLLLGLLATPSAFPLLLGPAVLLAATLVLLARPLAVWLCLMPFRFSRNEIAFVAWVGLRGAVSILLAIVPVLGGLPLAQAFFVIAFLVVLTSLMIQGWTIRPVARWLGLILPPRIGPLSRTEIELPGISGYELVSYTIHPDSPVAQGERLPRWARPSLIARGGRIHNVHTIGRLQPGDVVHMFATPRQLPLLDRLFAGSRPLSPEDEDYFGEMSLSPQATVQAIAESYGLPLAIERAEMTLGELFRREFQGRVEVGDRLRMGAIELVVREMEEDEIAEVGMVLEPAAVPRHTVPLFQSPGELAAATRELRRRLRAWLRRARRRPTSAGG